MKKQNYNSNKIKSLIAKGLYSLAVITGLASAATYAYPSFSDQWNKYVSSKIISEYIEYNGEEISYEEELKEAQEYNKNLFAEGKNNISKYTHKLSGLEEGEDMWEVINPDREYEGLVNGGNGQMMGYVEIAKIDVSIPIYHYTSKEVLDKGVGHLYGTSLPVGGEGSHSVLTGHCGLVETRLFTDLTKLKKKDVFKVCTLNEDKYYEVDQIKKVKPDNLKNLSIEEGKDYVTLVTCTPYGVNTHRLLVRGHRIEVKEVEKRKDETVLMARNELPFPWWLFAAIITTLLLAVVLLYIIWKKL